MNGTLSTLPLVIFGGVGADQLVGGQADDVIFGDKGMQALSTPLPFSFILARCLCPHYILPIRSYSAWWYNYECSATSDYDVSMPTV